MAAQELATMLLSMPAPSSVQQQTKSLLASLHTSRSAYHNHKVTWCKDFSVSCKSLGLRCSVPLESPSSTQRKAAVWLSSAPACLTGFCVSPELHCFKCFLKIGGGLEMVNLEKPGSRNTQRLFANCDAVVCVSTVVWLRVYCLSFSFACVIFFFTGSGIAK